MKSLKKNRYIILLLCCILLSGCQKKYIPKNIKPEKNYRLIIRQAKSFVKKEKMSQNYFLLADLSIHSGKKRLFLYDFKLNRFTESFMVLHGKGGNSKVERSVARFSNQPKSYCSSLGKYVLENNVSESRNYGEKIIMKGKENTNSNAEKRMIVLHPSKYAPDRETYPKYLPANSNGCPSVSRNSFDVLKEVVTTQNREVLLWIIK